MITIIAGTNRKDSMTLRVSQYYLEQLRAAHADVHLLSLEDKNVWSDNEEFDRIQQDLLIPSEKFVLVMPEYNGSFPGILKLMIDNSDIKKCWWYKKAALVGLADGRGGNLRGIEHMTNILHYLRVNVHYNKMPISKIKEEFDEQGNALKPLTRDAIALQLREFVAY